MLVSAHSVVALIGPIGWPELLIIGILGVIIFGKRLPEVGKSVGKGIVEFKKGLAGIEDDLNHAEGGKNPYADNRLEGSAKSETLETGEQSKQAASDATHHPSA